jgi:hypothetical protein
MEQNLIRLHTIAGLYCGQEYTCGKKIRYPTEEGATKAATALNKRPETKKKYDVEPYPCPFCREWHVGRKMSVEELTDIEKKALKTK